MADGKIHESLLCKDGITLGKVIDTYWAAELSHAQMREVDGNPKPTESVNVVVQNNKGYTKHKYYVLHITKGAVSMAGKNIMQKCARKMCQVRGMWILWIKVVRRMCIYYMKLH